MSTIQPPSRRATYEDLKALPSNLIGELIAGRLYSSPRPAVPHARAITVLGMILGNAFQRGQGGPGGWLFLFEPELHLGEDVLVPDLAGWRKERTPQIPDEAAVSIAPDWVCEGLSRPTEKKDRKEKMPVYAREEVPHVWLLDPGICLLEVFEREGAIWRRVGVFSDDDKVRAAPFEAIELDLSELWG
jgi:Uma2 family endonuclease